MALQKRWLIKGGRGKNDELAARLKLSLAAVDILVDRGFDDKEKIEEFLNPLAQKFSSPYELGNMENAVRRIMAAIAAGEKICIYGDYDVDGITATAVLYRVLAKLRAAVDFYIPERESEGYGINGAALNKLYEAGFSLVITVDCGISSRDDIAKMQGALDVIVTDHHELPTSLPDCAAVINPKLNSSGALQNLSGAGVAYKLCQALWQAAKNEKYTSDLDIAALGTVADLVPLTGENRILVAKGLKELSQTKNIGLKALINVAGLGEAEKITAGDVGFKLAPRLNAAGRMDSATWGVRLLLTEDEKAAEKIAARLNEDNLNRQQTEADILALAEAKYHEHEAENKYAIVVCGENWHVGVIGIVASRLVEKFYKPTIVLSKKADGTVAGSCRSIAGFPMHEALAKASSLLLKHGGHAMAAGLSLKEENVAPFRQFINNLAAETLSKEDYLPEVAIDRVVALAEVDFPFVDTIEKMAPFGMGNPRPVFAAIGAAVSAAKPVGKEGRFTKFAVCQGAAKAGGIAWETSFTADEMLADKYIDLAFRADINEWNGKRSIQLTLSDYRRNDSVKTRLDELFAIGRRKAEPYENIGAADHFFTKAAGTSFDNRQMTLRTLKHGDALKLVRDKKNEFDKNAVMICTEKGDTVGFLKAELVKYLAPLIDGGRRYAAEVSEVTGKEHENAGLNIIVRRVAENNLNLNERQGFITRAAAKELLIGKAEYHESQIKAIDALERCQNTLLIMGTGRGKSAVFQTQAIMQAVNNHKLTLIVYPLRALVNDQYLGLIRKLQPLGLRIYKGNGTLTSEERNLLNDAVIKGEADIILTTPEFLAAHWEMFAAAKDRIGMAVIDESHHIADAKRSGYKSLGALIKKLGSPVTLAVTATADDKTANLICGALNIKNVIVDSAVRENIRIRDGRNYQNKLEYLAELIARQEKTLIFVNSRKQAVEIADSLRNIYGEWRDKIGFYHAGLSDEWRVRVEDWFRSGELNIVVATSAFGEGIDLPDIRNVVLYHLPFDGTSFNQQCGRAGRDGERCMVHLIFGERDIRLNELILKERAPERDAIGALYVILKKAAFEKGFTDMTNGELSAEMEKNRRAFMGEGGVGASLKVLEELGLICRETNGSRRRIFLQPPPKEKLDINSAESYAEGIAEKAAFEIFSRRTMEMDILDLLDLINRPIFPHSIKNQEI